MQEKTESVNLGKKETKKKRTKINYLEVSGESLPGEWLSHL